MYRSTSHPEWCKAIPHIKVGVCVGQVPQLNLTIRALAKNVFDKKSNLIRNGARPFPTLRRALARKKIEGFRSTPHPEWRKAIPYIKASACSGKNRGFSFHLTSGMAQGPIPYIKTINIRKTALGNQGGFEC